LELTIEKLIYGGDGLARLPADERGRGKAVFIPFVLEGERIDARITEEKPGFARAHAEKILSPAPTRIEARCPYFLHCGGCQYQHITYEHQLQIKAAILHENLARLAKIELAVPLQVHASPPWNYRNRTRMQVRAESEFLLGYYRHGSHQVLAVEECPISSPLLNRAIAGTWDLGRQRKLPAEVLEIEFFANADDTELLVEIYCRHEIEKRQLEIVAETFKSDLSRVIGAAAFRVSSSPHAADVQSHADFVAGARHLEYKSRDVSYRVSAGAFFQTNRHLVDEVVSVVTSGDSGRTALDLYAGVGLFSAVLKRNFERVIAVEVSPLSFSDLQYNSAGNVKAVQATSEQYLERSERKSQPDLVIVDPPRGGLGKKVAQSLVQLGPPRLTYVSCDPATLARDLIVLKAAGYEIEQAHLFDLFPQTFHIETVLMLRK
jgi:23S rRNA (uracil1939-C5)-methyltransferase